jgi:hypothetical protein
MLSSHELVIQYVQAIRCRHLHASAVCFRRPENLNIRHYHLHLDVRCMLHVWLTFEVALVLWERSCSCIAWLGGANPTKAIFRNVTT